MQRQAFCEKFLTLKQGREKQTGGESTMYTVTITSKGQASKADFSDCLIERLSAAAGCKRTLTFDQVAAKTTDMKLI